MAYITTTSLTEGFRDRAEQLAARLLNWAVRHGEKRARRDQIAHLDALSDAELARRGLTRDGIVAHVFRDRLFY